MKIIFSFACFLTLFFHMLSCSPSISYKEMLADELSAKYINILKNKESMSLVGTGGGMIGQIKSLSYSFSTPKLVDLSKARQIATHCAELFLEMINDDEKIKPFLDSYPFLIGGLELIITFYPFDPSDAHGNARFIHKVFLLNGELHYRQYDIKQQKDVTVYKELYEEAQKKSCAYEQ